MANSTASNRRIAKNAVVVYANMFLSMLIGLYTSRLGLEALGVADYGLFSVVGGVIALFTFVSGSLSNATTRFINVEMGREDGDLNRVFNVCNALHIGMALILFVLLEVGGTYYIVNCLNMPVGKEGDAMFIFQLSTAMCCLGITNAPFGGLFFATEKFLFMAVVGLSLKVLQMVLLIWLCDYDGNRLKAFALLMTIPEITTFCIYRYYCHRYWPSTVRWRLVRESRLYKEIVSFSSFNLLTMASFMSRDQGSALLINHFFGTSANAAYAVARSVNTHVTTFANSFQGASWPQITQSYVSGDRERAYELTRHIGKYGLLLVMLAFFPLWAELDFVLHIWLSIVPDGAVEFCRVILLMVFFAVTEAGIGHIANTSGKISRFNTAYSVLTLSCVPIGFVVLSTGVPAYMLLVFFLMMDIVWRLVQFYLARRILRFPLVEHFKQVYYPVLKISAFMVAILVVTQHAITDTLTGHCIRFIVVLLLTGCSDLFIGLNREERKRAFTYISSKIHKR